MTQRYEREGRRRMYVGREYTATRTGVLDTVFRCVHCGFVEDCFVLSVGIGKGNSPFFADNAGAAARAEEHADQAAVKDAELTLTLCPCPKCGERNGRKFIVQSALALLLAMLVPWGIGWAISSTKGESGDVALWILGIMGFALPFTLFFGVVEPKWTTARQRVLFRSEQEQAEGTPRKRKKKKRRRAPSKLRIFEASTRDLKAIVGLASESGYAAQPGPDGKIEFFGPGGRELVRCIHGVRVEPFDACRARFESPGWFAKVLAGPARQASPGGSASTTGP